MKLVEELIAEKETSAETQDLQRLIRDELAQLVEQAKKQGSGGGGHRKPQGGKQSKPGTPMGEGTGRPAPARPPTAPSAWNKARRCRRADRRRELMRRLWGHLPEKVREQMLNAPVEQFLPKYEKLIENYFRRLSEERP